jgi:MipA family protein
MFSRILSSICLFSLSSCLYAADDWETTIGISTLIAPQYEGADEYRVIPVPLIDTKYKNYFFTPYRGLGANIIQTKQIQAGPVMTYRLWQNEDANPALKGLGNIPGTLELGGYINYYLPTMRFGADIKQGVNGHRGAIANVSVEHIGKIGEKIHFAVGPRVAWADVSYMQTYFGITEKQSSRSGLPVYTPGAGFKEVGIGGFIGYNFNKCWRISTFGRLTYLLDTASDSPIVKDEGTPVQLSLAVSLGYTF